MTCRNRGAPLFGASIEDMTLTRKETLAIERLKSLAKVWPQSLSLQSWSGSLHVLKVRKGKTIDECKVTVIDGIPNDGGDPDGKDVLDP
jgi:hypothetical protein